MKESMITTVDNPYNPLDNFDEWYAYDLRMGYHTCERLARIAITSDQLTDSENEPELEVAYQTLMETGAINKEGQIVKYKIVYSD